MPILQNKLVIKSIEALHDEALALMPNTASSAAVSSPTILQSVNTPQDAQINAPEGKSADEQPEAANNHDIMARIDHLLKKLDEDECVTIAQPQSNKLRPNDENVIDSVRDTVTTNDKTVDNSLNLEKPVLSVEDARSHAGATLDEASNRMAEIKAVDPLGNTELDASESMLVSDQQGVGEAIPDQAQALADIATAIYQARQQGFDRDFADSNQHSAAPFDIDKLTTTIADEVRQTVSSVMIAELPKMVHNAVREAIRALPTASFSQPKSVTNKQVTTKNATPRTTTVKKKAAKKVAAKKTPAKKVSKKRTK